MARPRIHFTDQLIELCRGGWRPQKMNGLLLSILRMHFTDADNIEVPSLQKKVWKEDDTTGILIEVIGAWKPTTTEKRPAIILKRNAIKILRLGIDDRMMMGTGSDGLKTVYATYVQGSSTAFCICGETAEAELLATEVYRELSGFGPLIRSYMNLHKFQVVEVGEPSTLEEASQNYVVPVTVAYAFEEAWEITEDTAPPYTGGSLTIEPN